LRRVGEGVVRESMLAREYMFDLPMTQESTARVFWGLSKGVYSALGCVHGTHNGKVHLCVSRVEESLFDQASVRFLVDHGVRDVMDEPDVASSRGLPHIVAHQRSGFQVALE
jgi:hypothetical protein